MKQLRLNLAFDETTPELHIDIEGDYRQRLDQLLAADLDFHGYSSRYLTHNLHAFAAKFPPQLPRLFTLGLTDEGDRVLDPMMGSGTSILETYLLNRQGIGCDIDPLAILSTRVKTSPIDVNRLIRQMNQILTTAAQTEQAVDTLNDHFDTKTVDFIRYWFSDEAITELLALLSAVLRVEDAHSQQFFRICFSSVIITKSGGVSMARDLAHTRPHRVQDKAYRSPLAMFAKRAEQNIKSLIDLPTRDYAPHLIEADAQTVPLAENSIDLIVTSPPYAGNAIDYMRAHKFSLVWFGYPIGDLSTKRGQYIGGEALRGVELIDMPDLPRQVIATIAREDEKRAGALHRYYSEMTRTLRQMLFVLKPGKAAILVVGNSVMRGIDTRTQDCLAAIGEAVGFELAGIGIRHLDRDRRMMPARRGNRQSQIEDRMHEEYVIGLYKPEVE
jgi:DNA modification methylase